jgi:hypothetical protein
MTAHRQDTAENPLHYIEIKGWRAEFLARLAGLYERLRGFYESLIKLYE